MVLAQTSREDGSHHQGTQLPLSDGSTEKSPPLRHHRRAVSLRKVSPPETPLQGCFTEKSKWGGDTVVCCYLTNGKDPSPCSEPLSTLRLLPPQSAAFPVATLAGFPQPHQPPKPFLGVKKDFRWGSHLTSNGAAAGQGTPSSA